MKKIVLILSFMIVLAFNGMSAEAGSSKMYTVEAGDNLYRISVTHNITVTELKSWNQLDSETIKPGLQLKVADSKTNTVEPKLKTLSQIITEALSKIVDGSTTQPAETVATASTKEAIAVVQSPEPSRSTTDNIQKEFFVEATAYTAYCTGCSGITKTGQNLRQNPNMKVIAVDPNVIPLGTKVHVEGYGYAVAGDIGGAIKGNRIDVFIPTKNEAFKWGRKDVKIKILE